MGPTRVLSLEHQTILGILDLLETLADRLAGGDRRAAELAPDMVDYIASFADRLHHGKEEELLFPALARAGMPADGGPVAVMLSEHERGRALVGAMRRAVADGLSGVDARTGFADAACGFAQLLREHIHKEDHVLFPMAEQMLDATVRDELLRAFEAHDGERHAAEHRRCAEVLERLRRELS